VEVGKSTIQVKYTLVRGEKSNEIVSECFGGLRACVESSEGHQKWGVYLIKTIKKSFESLIADLKVPVLADSGLSINTGRELINLRNGIRQLSAMHVHFCQGFDRDLIFLVVQPYKDLCLTDVKAMLRRNAQQPTQRQPAGPFELKRKIRPGNKLF